MTKRTNQYTNPWTEDELIVIKNNYKKGDKYLTTLLPNRTQGSIKTKRIRIGCLVGEKSQLKGTKIGPVVKWSSEEISILKKYYPLIGNHSPKYRKSMIQLIPKKTFPQIRYYSEEVLGLVINHQKDG